MLLASAACCCCILQVSWLFLMRLTMSIFLRKPSCGGMGPDKLLLLSCSSSRLMVRLQQGQGIHLLHAPTDEIGVVAAFLAQNVLHLMVGAVSCGFSRIACRYALTACTVEALQYSSHTIHMLQPITSITHPIAESMVPDSLLYPRSNSLR